MNNIRNREPDGLRLKSPIKNSLLKNRYAYIGANVLSFTLTTLIVYFLASSFGGNTWFSLIYGVVLGMLAFCCLRTWFEPDAFDTPDTKAYIALAGTLSFVGIILAYITLGMYPFGEHTVLIIDMHHQYVAFFSLLREKLTGGGGMMYSDSLGLGGGFLPLFAYYLASPLNLLTVLFPRENLTEAIEFITLLKITAGGVTFAIFSKRFFGRNDFTIVAGGVMYSLMSFFICHSWNIMWLDPLVLLPLVFLGMHMLLRDGKPALYCITLAMTLITNYYIAYMICVFLVVCYLANALADGRSLTPADRAQRFWRFCWGSILGGCLSAFMVFPAFTYLQQTSGAEDEFARAVANNFNLFSLIQRLLYGAYPSMRGDALPNIYCTVFALLAFFVFALCSKLSVRRRVAWCGVCGFVALCMSINWTNFAWHGFHFPNDLPYRFSFLLSFAMVFIAAQVLANLDKLQTREVVKATIITVGLILLEQQFGDGEADFTMIYASIGFVLVYAALMALRSAGKLKQSLCCALCVLFIFAEAGSNTSILLTKLDKNEYYTEREDFVYDYPINKATVEAVEAYDDDMYRSEIIPRKTCNDPSLFGYSGLTVFASSNRKSVTTLMGKLGYAVNGVNSYLYKNFIPVTDSMLGLKYVTLNKQINGHQQLEPLDTVKLETTTDDGITQTDERYIHVNNAALSKAFMVNRGIVGWSWDNANPFTVQNSLMTAAAGVEDVYTPVYYYKNGNGETSGNYYADYYDNYDEVTDEEYDPEDSVYDQSNVSTSEYNCTVDINGTYFSSAKVSEAMDSNFTITRTLDTDGQYFVYVDCRAAESISVSTTPADGGDDTTISSSPNEANVIDLGHLSQGSKVSVSFTSEITCGGNIFLAYLNEDVFNRAIEKLADEQLQVENYKEGKINGTITALEDGVMFTSIPYDSGWKVKVDGRKVATFALGDALLCYSVPAGTHDISMKYFPKGFAAGILVSLIALAILLLLIVPKWNEKARELTEKYILEPRRIKRQLAAEERARAMREALASAASAVPDTDDAADDIEDDFE